MDGRRLGRVIRAVRLERGLSQRDVAALAGVSQPTVSRAEHGRLDRVSTAQFERICGVLRIAVFLDARWLDGDVDRLIDRVHAAVVEVVVRFLRDVGWDVLVEFGFNHYGDRGSVDVLAWHAEHRTLLIVEVKSRLTDLQATFSRFDTKVRVVPAVVGRERGWQARHLGRLLVMPGTKANRASVGRHAETFATAFPERMPAVRAWLHAPNRPMGGVWYLASMPPRTQKQALGARRPRTRASPGTFRA